MPFKNQDLGWIRLNFKKEEEKTLRDFASKTNLAPVDWYEDLDEETKEAYNKNVLDKTANTYSAIYKFSPEEEQAYRDRFDIDYTTYIKDPIAANELHKKIMEFIQELIGDYRWDEWKTKMNLNEDIDQRKIKSWALFSDSILEKVYQKVTKEEDLDYLWNEMSRKAVSDDQQFAIDYFYNYRKMELGLDYNNELIGKMELKKDINELKEAAIGFKPDATSRARASVETMMGNLDKTMEYLQGNAFVKTYKEEDAAKIKELTNIAREVIGDLLGIIDSTPDTKAKGVDEIRLKNYKPLEENSTEAKEEALKEKIRRAGKIFRDPDASKEEKAKVEADIKSYKKELDSLKEEMDLDKTWADTFGDKSEELALKQLFFASPGKAMKKLFGLDFPFNHRKEDGKIVIGAEGYNPDGTLFSMKDFHKEKIIKTFQEKMPSADVKPNMGGGITVHLKESVNEDLNSIAKKMRDRTIATALGSLTSNWKEINSISDIKVGDEVYDSNKHVPQGGIGRGGAFARVVQIGDDKITLQYDEDRKWKETKTKKINDFLDFFLVRGKSINENIETLLSPEDLKYYRAHRDEIEDILNAEFRSSKLSAKDAVEKHKSLNEDKKYKRGDKLKIKLKNGKEFDLTFDSYSKQSGVAFGKFDGDRKPFQLDAVIDEGTCGYNTDVKTGKKFKTPGGLEERIKTLVKEFTKQK